MKTDTWKKIGIILGILALALVIIGIITPRLLDLNRYQEFIVSKVEKAVGGKVEIGRISWGVAHRIWMEVDGFSIIGASAFPGDVKLTRIFTSVSIPQLLAKKIVLKNLRLESSEVKFRLEPATKETGPPVDGIKSAGVHLPVGIEIQQFTGAIKQLEIDDALSLPGQTLTHVFSDVDLSATNIAPAKEMTFNLALRDKSPSGHGTLKARGTFKGLTKALTLENPDLKLKAILEEIHVGAIRPYLENSRLKGDLAGSISMEVNYEGDLGQNLSAQGEIDFSKLTYSNPSLWDTALPGQNTTATFQINLDPQNLTVEKIALKLGTLSLDARGVVHTWNKEPVIKNAEFSSDLPLGDLIPLIPWKKMGKNAGVIRSILEKGGRLVLNKLILPEISLLKLPATVFDLVPVIEMTAQVNGVTIPPTPIIPKIGNIEGTVQLANGIVQVQGLTARIFSVDLPPISAKITNLLEKPKIDANINGRIKLDAIADEKFQKLLENIGLEKVDGTADLDLILGLETARPADFQVQGDIELQDFRVKTIYTPVVLHGLNAKVDIKPAVVTISQASAIVTLPAAANSADDHFTLDIQGHLDDWRRKPSVTLQNIKTSQIPLPLLASMVPWEKLGQSAKPVKEILDAGGFITIEALSLPTIDLARPSKDLKHLLPRIKFAASLTDITVPHSLSPIKIEGITGRVNLEKNVLVAENIHSRLGPISLPTLNIQVTDIATEPKGTIRAKGPLQVAAAGDAQIEKLLMQHGLKHLTGSAEVDMRADFDQQRPKNWAAKGSLVLKGVRAETHPANVVLENLEGSLKFEREKVINITAQDLSAQINQASVKMSGKFINVGAPNMLIATKAYAQQLDLSHLAAFIPTLKDLKLNGRLDMDLDVHVPYATPVQSRITGTLTTRNVGFQMAGADLAVENGNAQIVLAGDSATIKAMTLKVNDQNLAVAGQLSNPTEPNAKLLVTSSNLNLDRFFPQGKTEKPSSKALKGKGEKPAQGPFPEKKSSKKELPPAVRKLTADLQVKAEQGHYKGLQFKELNLNLLYKHGVIKHYELNFGVDQGRVNIKGAADLRDLGRFTFTVEPNIKELHLEKVAPLFGIEKSPYTGPMSLTGRLQGHTGNMQALLTSLSGNLETEMGPGNLTKIGRIGDLFLRILSITSVRGTLSGSLVDDLTGKGLSFRKIKAQTAFDKGVMALKYYQFVSDAMMINSQGHINLIDEKLDLDVVLEPLRSVGKAIGDIPLVGQAAEDLTEIRLEIKGPLEKPEIRPAEARQILKGIKTGVKEPERILKDFGNRLK